MTERDQGWSEETSVDYLAMAAVAVPYRAEHMAVMVSQVSFAHDAEFKFIDLGCGRGELSATLLSAFPNSRCVAIDPSMEMRSAASDFLARFGDRVVIEDYDMTTNEWHHHLDEVGLIVSSLAIHHLTDDAKRSLFESIARLSDADGAMIYFDMVAPRRPEGWQMQADSYARIIRKQAARVPNGNEVVARMESEQWNVFKDPVPDEEIVAPLSDQIGWLRDAGFAYADCFWLVAGHAVIGAYKSEWTGAPYETASPGVSYEDALTVALSVLEERPV